RRANPRPGERAQPGRGGALHRSGGRRARQPVLDPPRHRQPDRPAPADGRDDGPRRASPPLRPGKRPQAQRKRARSARAQALSEQEPIGTASRRAALRLLDAVLRKGLPLEAALDIAARDLTRADDRGFAHAIAAEALRRLGDLDALIDSATKKRLPDDAKARFALRIALVQALALDTPPHAAIATVLPLLDGGPRRLVHGVFGALMRGGATRPELPGLPPAVDI